MQRNFNETLRIHEQSLTSLRTQLETSEEHGRQLRSLLEDLSKQNEDLKKHSDTISLALEERTEELNKVASTALEYQSDVKMWRATGITSIAALILVVAIVILLGVVRR